MTAALKTFVTAWMLKAEQDIVCAQRLLEIEPMLLDNACFHCQQAIEKSLKAFLCYHGKDIVKTHDIDFLLGECSNLDTIFDTIDSQNINEFAVQARYPSMGFTPEADEAKEYYHLAIKVYDLVKEKMVFPE